MRCRNSKEGAERLGSEVMGGSPGRAALPPAGAGSHGRALRGTKAGEDMRGGSR